MSEPGWYPHPEKPNTLQYWDGQAWAGGPSKALARNAYLVAIGRLPIAAWFVYVRFVGTGPACASISMSAVSTLLVFAAVFVIPLLIAFVASRVSEQHWRTRLYVVVLVWGVIALLQSPLMVFGSLWAGIDC